MGVDALVCMRLNTEKRDIISEREREKEREREREREGE